MVDLFLNPQIRITYINPKTTCGMHVSQENKQVNAKMVGILLIIRNDRRGSIVGSLGIS